MLSYSKTYLSPTDLIQNLMAKGMVISSVPIAEEKIIQIGYYRLKGYFYTFYDNSTNTYPNTKFDDILSIYEFDTKLSRLLFDYLLKIEVTLRARLTEAFRQTNDVLPLYNPSYFEDKHRFWENYASMASEIARSSDHFIKYNYDNHDGVIPVWAIVEVLQYGTLSKVIKNLKTGIGTVFNTLASNYSIPTNSNTMHTPSPDMFTSWIQATASIRNICAHGGRIYKRVISSSLPALTTQDAIHPSPNYTGVYNYILAMKYLRPDDVSWRNFVSVLTSLLSQYSAVVQTTDLFFPTDWSAHL